MREGQAHGWESGGILSWPQPGTPELQESRVFTNTVSPPFPQKAKVPVSFNGEVLLINYL